jgi:uncharacterized membrane protein
MSSTTPPDRDQGPQAPSFAPTDGASPPPAATASTGTSTGLDPQLAGLLCYAVGWVSGLVMYLVESEHREVRFHAAQSVLVSLAVIALYIPLTILGFVPVIGLIAFLASILLGLAGFGLWVYLLVQGYQLRHVRLPVVGRMAEQWASR